MRHSVSLIGLALLLSCTSVKAAGGYYIAGEASPGWSSLLTALGYQSVSTDAASLFVIRSGASAPGIDWQSRVQQGAYLVVEGSSPTANLFGFVAAGNTVTVYREQYGYDPNLLVIWQNSVQIPVFQVPKQATVYSKDRWSGAPLLAGYTFGSGAVLWAAVDPGPSGYDRLPYLSKALQELGVVLPTVSRRLWAFFDYSYRTRVNPDYMAGVWRNMGIAGLWVSAWDFMERDPARDDYLRALIQAAHQNGIVVYAWLELPYVSNQFWNDHPQWREKNALLQDATVFFRQLMNLLNPDCFSAAAKGVTDLLLGFDWDGVNLSELYFDGVYGIDDLQEFTPFNDNARAEVKAKYGFDPVDLFRTTSPVYYRINSTALNQFFQYREDLIYRLHVQWIQQLLSIRTQRPGFALTVLNVDDLADPAQGQALAVNSARILQLQNSYDFDFVAEDPSTLWGLGPGRYTQMEKQYQGVTQNSGLLGVDINIVTRNTIAYPTLHQTGSEVAMLLNVSSNAFKKVGFYFEDSIFTADRPLLPATSGVISKFASSGNTISVSSPYGIGISYPASALVNGSLWPYADKGVIWLPSGNYTLQSSSNPPPVRLLDFNGNLGDVSLASGTLKFHYTGTLRALAIVDRLPSAIRINGAAANITVSEYKGRYSMVLPPGDNTIEVVPFPIAGPPAMGSGAAVNGASLAAGQPLTPGSLASVFGSNLATTTGSASSVPLPLILAESSVSMNDAIAPLFFAAPDQINFQVPWELTGFPQASFSVTVNGATGTPQTVNLAAYNPGIFMAGGAQGVILAGNVLADANNPVPRGGTLVIYCTGLGTVSNTPATGTAALSSPLSLTLATASVQIGNVPATVTFSGLAPGLVGVYQVNAVVPPDAPKGPSVPLVLSIGGVVSNTVTLAVQ